MAGTFGQGSPWSFSPFGTSGVGTNPWAFQPQYAQTHTTTPFGGYAAVTPQVPQIVQSLQAVPQQLQQLLQLAQVQQQQVHYLLQIVPQQLQQLQQLLAQSGSQGIIGPQIFGSPLQYASPTGLAGFSGQPGYVM